MYFLASKGVPMKIRASYLVFLFTTVMFLSVAAINAHDTPDQDIKIPGIIERKLSSEYAWVSLGEVLDSQGDFKHEYFITRPDISRKVEESAKLIERDSSLIKVLKDDECNQHLIHHYRGPEAGSTTEYMNSARIVFKGRIIAMDQGFCRGIAGTLMLVEVEEMIKHSSEFEIEKLAYVFYPFSRFSILGEHFCMGGFADGYRIKVDDGVIVATYTKPYDLNNQFIKAGAWGVLFEDPETGKVVNNLALKDLISLNATEDKANNSLKLWGDDLPDFDTLAEQIKETLVAAESGSTTADQQTE
jgi:hypothetical protein